MKKSEKKKEIVIYEYKCKKCGYVYMNTLENHRFHSTPRHEVRIGHGYPMEGWHTVASTDTYEK